MDEHLALIIIDCRRSHLPRPQVLKLSTLEARRGPPGARKSLPHCRVLRISIPVDVKEAGAAVTVEDLTAGRDDYLHLASAAPNPRWAGQPYRFAYGLCVDERPANNCTAVCKVAVDTGTTLMWREEGLLPRRVSHVFPME